MPTYTTPDSLRKPAADDPIKDLNVAAKLAEDIGGLADTTQQAFNSRLGTPVALQEGTDWVWDPPNATHYIILDHLGQSVVRPTSAPVPSGTGTSFDW